MTKNHLKLTAVAALLAGLSTGVLAETWDTSTKIDNTTRTVSDGKIEIASPGDPSGTVNVNILNGGKLQISDSSGNASITGRVDITGATSALTGADGLRSIKNLTVGALILKEGATVTLSGNLTGVSETAYYVTVNSGTKLEVGGTIGGNFASLTNSEELTVGNVDIQSGRFTTASGATTTVTGTTVNANAMSNMGNLKFTGQEATVSVVGGGTIQGLGNWTAESDLTFNSRLDNGVSGNDSNADALLSVKGTLTVTELNNAGKVEAGIIKGGTISNFNGKNKDSDEVSITAREINVTKLSTGRRDSPKVNSSLTADKITASSFEQFSGTVTTGTLISDTSLQVLGGSLETGTLQANKFSTGADAVVSFNTLEINSSNPADTQAHAGWLKSGSQELVYDAKLQLQATGKLTNKDGEPLDSVTVNGASVLAEGAEILTKSFSAQGLNNKADISFETLTLTAGEQAVGYFWNTGGAKSTISTLTASSVSNDNSTITVDDIAISGKVTNKNNAELTITNSADITQLNNASYLSFTGVNAVIGQLLDDDDISGTVTMTDSTVTLADSSVLGDVTSTDSTIVYQSGTHEIKTLTSEGANTFEVQNLGETKITAESTSGDGTVTLYASGEETDKFETGQAAGEALLSSFTVDGEAVADEARVAEGVINDAVTLTRNADGTYSSEVTKNSKVDALGSVAVLGVVNMRHELNSLTKRMGELRDSPEGVGAWARLYGSENEYGAQNVTAKNTTIQIGSDVAVGEWKIGAALSYTDGNATYDKGDAESDTFGAAIYGTWMSENGQYVDLIARYARLDQDFKLNGMNGSYDNNGYALSAEYGWRFDVGSMGFVEPQAQLTYMYVDGDSFTAENGVKVDQDSFESIIGRIGVRGGLKFPNNRGTIYARFSYLYDFDGELTADVANGGNFIKEDIGGSWVEYGVGANFNLTDRTYTYVDLERTSGGEVRENWRWNVGVRHVF